MNIYKIFFSCALLCQIDLYASYHMDRQDDEASQEALRAYVVARASQVTPLSPTETFHVEEGGRVFTLSPKADQDVAFGRKTGKSGLSGVLGYCAYAQTLAILATGNLSLVHEAGDTYTIFCGRPSETTRVLDLVDFGTVLGTVS